MAATQLDYLHKIEGLVILDNEGKRVFSKYYTPAYNTFAKQTTFEKTLFNKTSAKVCAHHDTAHTLGPMGISRLSRQNVTCPIIGMHTDFVVKYLLCSPSVICPAEVTQTDAAVSYCNRTDCGGIPWYSTLWRWRIIQLCPNSIALQLICSEL